MGDTEQTKIQETEVSGKSITPTIVHTTKRLIRDNKQNRGFLGFNPTILRGKNVFSGNVEYAKNLKNLLVGAFLRQFFAKKNRNRTLAMPLFKKLGFQI